MEKTERRDEWKFIDRVITIIVHLRSAVRHNAHQRVGD